MTRPGPTPPWTGSPPASPAYLRNRVQPVRRHAPAVVGHRDGLSFDLVEHEHGIGAAHLPHLAQDSAPPGAVVAAPWRLQARVPGVKLGVGARSTATSGDIDDDGDAEPEVYDVDRDGCADLVMSRSQGEVGTDAPLVNHNKSSGQFEAMPPERSPDRTAISGSLCRTRGRERRRGDRLSRCSDVTTALTVGPARWTTSERG